MNRLIRKSISSLATEFKGDWYNPILRMIQQEQAGGASGYSYHKGVKDGYLGTDIVYSGIDLLSSACASVPIRAMKRLADGKSEPYPDDHPLNVLLKNPNPLQRKNAFVYAAVAFRLLGGDCYIWANTGIEDPTDQDAEPLELWAMSPLAATLRTEQGGWYYQINQNQSNGGVMIQQRKIPVDVSTGRSNILQWSTFNPNTLAKGVSPLEPANVNMDIYRFGNIWNKTYFQKGCRPSTALVSEKPIGDKQYNRMKKDLIEAYSGMANGNGRPMLLENGTKPVELSKSPKDADFSVSHDTMQKDLCRTLRIPPILLNLGGDATFSNQKEAKLSLWDDTIVPMTDDLVAELDSGLVPRYRDPLLFLEADYSKVPALEQRRTELWERAEKSDDLTVNERREMKGYAPIAGGDVILVEGNKIPLSMAGFEPPE